jgi:hypothetical protein
MDGQHQSSFSHSTQSSSSSAIDLPGLANSTPPSPTLRPLDSERSFARRRTSWTHLDAGQDPLRLILPTMEAGPSATRRSFIPDEDPFHFPDDHFLPTNGRNSIYNDVSYTSAQNDPSSSSLISTADSDRDWSKDEDQIRLTRSNSPWQASADALCTSANDMSIDSERTGGATSRTKRRTLRYDTSTSPLKRTGSALRVISKHFRRASLRVVNLAGHGLDNSIRLSDEDHDNDEYAPAQGQEVKEPFEEQWTEDQVFVTRKLSPLRGRTLGFLGSSSTFRLRLYHLLSHS